MKWNWKLDLFQKYIFITIKFHFKIILTFFFFRLVGQRRNDGHGNDGTKRSNPRKNRSYAARNQEVLYNIFFSYFGVLKIINNMNIYFF